VLAGEKVARSDASLDLISATYGGEVAAFLASQVALEDPATRVLDTASRFNVESLPAGSASALVNLKRLNDIRDLDSFLAAVNDRLPLNGVFVGRVETIEQRRARLFQKFSRGFAPLYYFADFVFKRVFPRLPVTRALYLFVTRDRNRVMSLAETLGRLVYCGFEIEIHQPVGNLTYFVARKAAPASVDGRRSYGPLLALRRVGLHGRPINVYKLRTMFAYSEYVQAYVYRQNLLQAGGKFRNDFRITGWGRLLRKYWLDELPMLFNLLKGEVKLVGVRPLSQQYLKLYRDDLRQLRLAHKPGLIPPFYADLPKTLQEIMDSEERYLRAYERAPLATDFRYFWRALYNIVVGSARSA
jgi:hypothetical protein